MDKDVQIKFNIDKLEELIRRLKKEKKKILRVGILGSQASAKHDKKDSNSNVTNADIGTFHEFGTRKMPRRSFLEDSLKFKLKFTGETGKGLRKSLFKQFFKGENSENDSESFLRDLGAKCLQIIEEAFATDGFGQWKQLSKTTERIIAKKHKVLTMDEAKNATMGKFRKAYKFWYGQLVENKDGSVGITGGRNILTETGKLRRSISFKLIKKK